LRRPIPSGPFRAITDLREDSFRSRLLLAALLLWPRPADPLPGSPMFSYGPGSVPRTWNSSTPRHRRRLPGPHRVSSRRRCVRTPRLNPLRYPPGTTLMAVVRVEPRDSTLPPSKPLPPPSPRPPRSPACARCRSISMHPLPALFYRALLADLRARIRQFDAALHDALTSWCESDTWMAACPWRKRCRCCSAWAPASARGARFGRRSAAPAPASHWMNLYASRPRPPVSTIFNPRPWTAATYRAALREVRQWH